MTYQKIFYFSFHWMLIHRKKSNIPVLYPSVVTHKNHLYINSRATVDLQNRDYHNYCLSFVNSLK